ncbi:MAG: hypothetical protein PQJ59_16340 [Spirochaetales bacterium]|nr:hypothetical protein [Spirochaetales bacterium]
MTLNKLIDLSDKSGLLSLTRCSKGGEALFYISRALSLDPRLASMKFIVRESEEGTSTLYALTQAKEEELLTNLSRQLAWADKQSRFISYKEAEGLTEKLAAKLKREFGKEELDQFFYSPIPRGGHIVMGMLSYCLGLPKSALHPPSSDLKRPVVYVDDCLISGLRSSEYMNKKGAESILAVLLAPKGVCEMSRHKELDFSCFAGDELDDLAPLLLKEDYEPWKERSKKRGTPLWVGMTEYFAFEWSEPENSFFNDKTALMEPGFDLLPPEQCLNTRHSTSTEPQDPKRHKD